MTPQDSALHVEATHGPPHGGSIDPNPPSIYLGSHTSASCSDSSQSLLQIDSHRIQEAAAGVASPTIASLDMPNMTAWDVYAQQLIMLGHGYPLWKGTPSNCQPGVQIGDVGYLSEGEFIRLFNAMASADDPLNAGGVPSSYAPFVKGDKARIVRTPNFIMPNTLCSRSIRQLGMDASVQATSSVGAAISWECTDEQGAVLHLAKPADREQLLSRRMMNHLKRNIRDWYTYASQDVDLPVQREDILFVFGFVKTTQWAAASYTEGGRSAKFTVTGGHGPITAGASAFATIGNCRGPIVNWGPPPPPPPSPRRQPRHDAEAQECLFLQYYKMKWKFGVWPRVIKARAGDDDLPDDPDDPSLEEEADLSDEMPSEDEDAVVMTPSHQTWDPANDILDYILDNSDATMALATDSDIIRLCRKHDCDVVPNDIPAFLRSVHPTIDVSEDGLGMLFFEDEPEVYAEPTAGAEQHIETEPDQPETSTPQESQQPAQEDDGEEPADPLKYPAIAVLEHNAGGVTSLAYSDDGSLLASGSDEAIIQIWNVRNQRLLHTCEASAQTISSLAFSPDGQELVSGSGEGIATVWSTSTGQERFQLTGHTNDVYSAIYSADGTHIATASADYTARLWNAQTGEAVSVLEGHNGLVMMAVFSPDGRYLASASADYTAIVWLVRTGQQRSTLRGHLGVIYSLAFAPDNRRIVTAGEDGTVRIWNTHSGEELVTLREHHGLIWSVAFTADGLSVISGSSDGTIKVCDSYGGELRCSINTGEGMVNAVAISADGSRVCASVGDNSIRVWNTATGQQLTRLSGHRDRVTNMKFSPDGRRVVSSSDDGTLRLWDLERIINQQDAAF